ncbi:uncharacterized protein LOC125947841 [Anopheles darlingi]|uniref:uncharacterized protein LOC125947841 n=1 Tax=Anopheles darlingi TaxID=43151 RepID=UPI00210047C6|nr:uncharacterized protein LOC125947841 [Anopheles darlingi]
MFLVVETVNDKGEKEWKVAPKRWVCTTKNTRRTVLFWPHEISSERQKQLARAGSSRPMKSWSRKECIIKQYCLSFDAANAAMKVLYSKRLPKNTSISLHSDPLSQQNMNSTVKINNIEENRNVEDVVVKLGPAPVTQAFQEDEALMLAQIKSMLESLMTRHNRIEEQNARIQRQNAEIKEQNVRIEQQKAELMKKLCSMQKRFANLNSQQFDLIDDTMDKSNFTFNRVETVEQMIDLENNLKDDNFRSELVSWLSFYVTGMDPAKRMGHCLDFLFSLEMQAKCLWSGISQDGKEAIAIRNRQNILELFKTIGTTPWGMVNKQDLALFFRNKLKRARQRLSTPSKRMEGNQTINELDDSEQLFENQTINNVDSSNTDSHIYTDSMEGESDTLFEVEILH